MGDEAEVQKRRRIEPYIYRNGRSFMVRLAAIAGAAKKSFPFSNAEEEAEALIRARNWRDRRATPAMTSSIIRAQDRHTRKASTLRAVSRSKAAKTGIRLYRESGLLIGYEVTCGKPNQNGILTRRFMINNHGEELALLYAVRQRLAWEARLWQVNTRITDDQWADLVKRWVRACPNQAFEPEKLSHPGSITEPSRNLFQARVMVRGEMHSRTFSARNYASVWEARLAALLWLLEFESLASQPKLYTIKARRGDGGRDGVNRCITKGRRGADELVFQVSFKDPKTGAQRNKKFSAGAVAKLTQDKEVGVYAAARAFRAAYEAWAEGRGTFDPEEWTNWRQVFLGVKDENL